MWWLITAEGRNQSRCGEEAYSPLTAFFGGDVTMVSQHSGVHSAVSLVCCLDTGVSSLNKYVWKNNELGRINLEN